MNDRQRTSCLVDSARFFLFHPDDYTEDEAGELDPPDHAFEEGLVVGIHLGADGNRIIEVVEGPLPEADRALTDKSWVFRLHVKHGVLYATDRVAGRDEYDWPREPHVTLRRGKYRAELWILKGDAMTEKNTSFFLSLERTESFDAIPAWREFPREDDPGGEAPKLPAKALRRVRHPKFGEGDVIRDDPPNLVVRFADGAERKLQAKFVTPI
jgi:hypothetical protein